VSVSDQPLYRTGRLVYSGQWVNSDGRYQENVKDLAAAYSVIAMKHALQAY